MHSIWTAAVGKTTLNASEDVCEDAVPRCFSVCAGTEWAEDVVPRGAEWCCRVVVFGAAVAGGLWWRVVDGRCVVVWPMWWWIEGF